MDLALLVHQAFSIPMSNGSQRNFGSACDKGTESKVPTLVFYFQQKSALLAL